MSKLDFDEDDPLAGLGLSDDDDMLGSSSTSKPKKAEVHSRKKSHVSSKAKIDPEPSQSSLKSQRSMSVESDDIFLASDSKPRASNKSKSFQRINSWEDPSIGTASETEITPRGAGKHTRQSPRGKKGKVQPGGLDKTSSPRESKSPRSENTSFDSDGDLPGIEDKSSPRVKDQGVIEGKGKHKPEKKAKQNEQERKPTHDDMFDDDGDLPGLDDSLSPKASIKVSSKNKSDEPVRRATSALDDLLGPKTKPSESKARKPTMLDQILTGSSPDNTSKNEGKTPRRGSSPDDDLMFGSYSPSASGAQTPKKRPTTAPSRRSVRFADDLGVGKDDVLAEARPGSAPSSKRDKNVRDSVQLSPRKIDTKIPEKHPPAMPDSPRRQKSTPARSKSQESSDWLGLGEDMSDEFGLNDTGELFSPRSKQANNKKAAATAGATAGATAAGAAAEAPVTKEDSMAAVRVSEGSKSKEKEEKVQRQESVDKFTFPWEDPDGVTRRRFSRRSSSGNLENKELLAQNTGSAAGKSEGDAPNGKAEQSIGNKNLVEARNFPITNESHSHLALKEPNRTNNSLTQNAAGQDFIPSTQVQNMVAGSGSSLETATVHPGIPPGTPYTQNIHGTIQQQLTPNPLVAAPFVDYRLTPGSQIFTPGSISQIPGPSDPGYQVLAQELNSMKLQVEKLALEKRLQEDTFDDYKVQKRHMESERAKLEVEIKSLQKQVRDVEERKTKQDLDSQANTSMLEEKVRKLELEKDQISATLESLKIRHKNENDALESSHKTRFQILENSYKQREERVKENYDLTITQLNEKLSASETEKSEILSSNKKRIELFEKNKVTELDRLKELHKKAIEDVTKTYEEQLDQLRLLKEREVQAAMSAFSQTKSLHSLIQEVQHSAREVGFLKEKIEKSHHSTIDEKEQSLKSRDEYLRNLQDRIYKQEAESDQERSRLQGLIARLEIQLKEQRRQTEQREWTISQNESKLKAQQSAFEDERRTTMEELKNERANLDKMREQMISEQKRILTECYDERKKILVERSQPSFGKGTVAEKNTEDNYTDIRKLMQSELDTLKSELHKNSSDSHQLKNEFFVEKEKLAKEKEDLQNQKLNLKEEKIRLELYAKALEDKAKDIQHLSQEASSIYKDGVQAKNEAEQLKAEIANQLVMLNSKKNTLDTREKQLMEEKAILLEERMNLQAESKTKSIYCKQCGLAYGSSSESTNDDTASVTTVNSNKVPLPPASALSKLRAHDDMTPAGVKVSPPDVVLSSLEFKRSLRKWSAVKEKDDEFLEEESRFLENLQRKRTYKLSRK